MDMVAYVEGGRRCQEVSSRHAELELAAEHFGLGVSLLSPNYLQGSREDVASRRSLSVS